MIDNIETLLVLQKQGTMLKASSYLRVSQSTVSKRISSLEQYVGQPLISRSGRNVVLTDKALELVDRFSHLLAEIRDISKQKISKQLKVVSVGVSESILSSWGPKYILPKFKYLSFNVKLHCHRSPLVVDKVESGEYDLGICSGKINPSKSLISDIIHKEEMVLVAKKLFNKNEVLSIERSSSTWRSISAAIIKNNITKFHYLESFFSIGQIIKSSDQTGLIPLGVARALNFKSNQIKSFKPKIYRPVQLVYKKSKLDLEDYSDLINSFQS